MVPQGTAKDVARIVDYQRFRRPTLSEFIIEFEYEYVQFSFAKIYENLPDLDETGKKPTCTYHESWRKGVWGTPQGIMSINHIKELMKKNKVRALNFVPTSYYKELLKKHPLSFSWRDMHVVVYPKKVIESNDEEVLDNHKVYINGVSERLLRTKPESKLYKKWFSRIDKDSIRFDWRYLLDLDWPEQPGNDTLYIYFEGIYKGSEDVFSNIDENFKTGEVKNKPQVFHKRPETKGQRKKVMAEIRMANKAVRNMESPKPIRVANTRKPDDQVSKVTIKGRKVSAERRIRRIVVEETRRANKEQKLFERKSADNKNQAKMHQLEMVCIERQEDSKIFKVSRQKANFLTKNGKYVHVPKHKWKRQLSVERTERKNNTEENRVTPTGPNRQATRTADNKHKPMNQYAKYQHIPGKYEWDVENPIVNEDGSYTYVLLTEEITMLWPEGEYEYLPVFYGKRHPTKAGEPFMIYQYNDDNEKILVQATKRMLRQTIPVEVMATIPKIKSKKKNIVQHNYPSKVGVQRKKVKAAIKEAKDSQNVESKEQVEKSQRPNSRKNKRTKQKNKGVEETRGDDKRVKTPNTKH